MLPEIKIFILPSTDDITSFYPIPQPVPQI